MKSLTIPAKRSHTVSPERPIMTKTPFILERLLHNFNIIINQAPTGNVCHRVSSLAIAETRRPGCTTSFCRTRQ